MSVSLLRNSICHITSTGHISEVSMSMNNTQELISNGTGSDATSLADSRATGDSTPLVLIFRAYIPADYPPDRPFFVPLRNPEALERYLALRSAGRGNASVHREGGAHITHDNSSTCPSLPDTSSSRERNANTALEDNVDVSAASVANVPRANDSVDSVTTSALHMERNVHGTLRNNALQVAETKEITESQGETHDDPAAIAHADGDAPSSSKCSDTDLPLDIGAYNEACVEESDAQFSFHSPSYVTTPVPPRIMSSALFPVLDDPILCSEVVGDRTLGKETMSGLALDHLRAITPVEIPDAAGDGRVRVLCTGVKMCDGNLLRSLGVTLAQKGNFCENLPHFIPDRWIWGNTIHRAEWTMAPTDTQLRPYGEVTIGGKVQGKVARTFKFLYTCAQGRTLVSHADLSHLLRYERARRNAEDVKTKTLPMEMRPYYGLQFFLLGKLEDRMAWGAVLQQAGATVLNYDIPIPTIAQGDITAPAANVAISCVAEGEVSAEQGPIPFCTCACVCSSSPPPHPPGPSLSSPSSSIHAKSACPTCMRCVNDAYINQEACIRLQEAIAATTSPSPNLLYTSKTMSQIKPPACGCGGVPRQHTLSHKYELEDTRSPPEGSVLNDVPHMDCLAVQMEQSRFVAPSPSSKSKRTRVLLFSLPSTPNNLFQRAIVSNALSLQLPVVSTSWVATSLASGQCAIFSSLANAFWTPNSSHATSIRDSVDVATQPCHTSRKRACDRKGQSEASGDLLQLPKRRKR